MSKKASNFQKKAMSMGYRGKEIFKPLNTGMIDEHVGCIREWIANIFFYTKNGTTIMIDAGYNYDRLGEKMGWLDIEPADIKHILITHQDTDHVGAVEVDSDLLFKDATLYLSEIENRYITGEVRRKVIFGLYKLPMVKSDNPRVLLEDGQILDFDGIKVECILCPGHTWGHMVYLIDDAYLFTGDTLWFGADGGYSFINSLAEDNELAKRSLAALEKKLKDRGLTPKIITGHTGWTDDMEFAFRHIDKVCNSMKRQTPHDPKAPYDGYVEDDDTEEKARSIWLVKQVDWAGSNSVDVVDDRSDGDSGTCTPDNGMKDGYEEEETADNGKVEDKKLDDKQKSRGYFNRHPSTIVNRNGYWSHDYKSTIRLLEMGNSQNHLDVGCGNGAFLAMLHEEHPEIILSGLDYSEGMVKCSRERLPEANIICGDAEDMPLPDLFWDSVSCNMSIHHYPHPEKALKEMHRILNKSGFVIINDLTGPGWMRYGMNWSFIHWNTGDHAVYSEKEMEDMLRDAGFRKVRSKKLTPFTYVCVGWK